MSTLSFSMVKAGNPLQIQFKQSPLQARILQTASSEFDELDYPVHYPVQVVLGSHMRPCKPSALDLTIANTWVRLQQSSQGGSL